MGFIKVKAFIWNIFDPKKSREVEFLADTGGNLYSTSRNTA